MKDPAPRSQRMMQTLQRIVTRLSVCVDLIRQSVPNVQCTGMLLSITWWRSHKDTCSRSKWMATCECWTVGWITRSDRFMRPRVKSGLLHCCWQSHYRTTADSHVTALLLTVTLLHYCWQLRYCTAADSHITALLLTVTLLHCCWQSHYCTAADSHITALLLTVTLLSERKNANYKQIT